MASFHARLGLVAAVATALGVLSSGLPAASAGEPRTTGEGDALQAVADVVLIEAECRAVAVDYGRLFSFAARNGLWPVDIMPAGERRAAFDAAYRRRTRQIDAETLCGALASEREAEIPGVFTPR